MEQVKIFNNELSSLYESKPPISKAKMTQLTRSAIKGIKFYKHVVQSVEKFIQKCRPEYKVPGLYVIDSIVRQSRHQFGYDRDVFVPRFSKNIVSTFQCLYKCPSEEKPKIVKVLNLWQKNNVFATEVIQPLLDMANMEVIETKGNLSTDDSYKPWTATNEPSDGPSNNLQAAHNKEGNDEAPVLNSAIISQLQELTSQLLNNPKMSDSQLKQENAVKFNKKLLDFDYGDDEEELEEEDKEENGHSAPSEPTAIALSMAQNLLSNPELLKQLQQMQQTIQQTEALKNELTLTERKHEELQQPQSSQQQVSHHQSQQHQELHLEQQHFHHQQQPTIHQQSQLFQEPIQVPHQSLDAAYNHPKLTQQNFHEVTFPGPHTQSLHSDIPLPVSQPPIPMMPMVNQSHVYGLNSPLFPPQQAFSPGASMMTSHVPLDQNYSLNQGLRNSSRLGINSAVIDMEHSISSLPENPSQLMHDQDERQIWTVHSKDNDDRERTKKDRSRSRSRSPRNRSKSSRKHKRSRSRSPKRRRSSSRSPSRHRRDKRSDSRDYDRDHDNERGRDRDRERDKEREKEKEKDRERRKKGLPPLKKSYLAVCTTTLWLGHVPKMVPENEIRDTFSEYGIVMSVDMIPPRGCAYICMEKRQDATKALNRLKNLKLQGSSIKMAWAPGKGVKGKEYKSFWDVEQGVTYIPFDKLPEKTKIPDLAEGGMIDDESVPDHLKDIVSKEEPSKVVTSEIALPKEGDSEKGSQLQSQLPSGTLSVKDKNQAHPSQSNQINAKGAQSQIPSLVTQPDQTNLMAGTPIHMPLMTSMPPPQFGIGLPGMVGPQVQPMLIPQIPLPMGVPPPNQIMMMNHSALMNPPPSLAVMNQMQSAMAAASLQTPHLMNAVSGIGVPPSNSSTNQKTNDSDQMDENSDATPTEEDRMRSRGDNSVGSGDMDIVRNNLVNTNTSLPSKFPSNPPTSIPVSFSTAFPPNVSCSLVVTSAPSLSPAHRLGGLPNQGQPWHANPNGPALFRMPGGMGMPQFNHLPTSNPQLINPGMPPSFGGAGANHSIIRPPPNNMASFGPSPSPNLLSPEGRNSKLGMPNKNKDEFDPNISANCVPLGRPRISFSSLSPQMQKINSPGSGPAGMVGPGLRMLGPPDNRGPPPRMGGPNPMRLPPPPPSPQDLGFRPQRPLIGGPNFGGQGPRGPHGPRFPFGRGQDGPIGQRPFLMRGPPGPGMGHRMDFRGPPPEFREERFGPDWRGRPPFGPPLDRDPFFDKNDMRMERNMDYPPDDWVRERGEDIHGGRRPDVRRGFCPPEERGWIPPDGPEEFGGPRDQFDGRGFDDRRHMMVRGERDRGRFNYGPGPREWDRDFERDLSNRRDIESEGGREGDRNRGRDRVDRRDRKESRWNRSRSRSREPTVDSVKNGDVKSVEDKDVLIIREGASPKKPVEVIDVEPICDQSTNESKIKPAIECVDIKLPETCNNEKVPSENNTPVKDEVSPLKEEC